MGDIDAPRAEEYVEALYRNVLDRDGDAEGIAFWAGLLEAESGLSDAELLLEFATSPENLEATLRDVLGLAEITPGEWDFI